MPPGYKEFEDTFRGPREDVKKKLTVYLPFVHDLRDRYRDACTVDLGCGRGEWLEMLGGMGFSAVGVDSDSGMLTVCRNLGLNVEAADALSFLKNLPDEQCSLISSFHVIEHVPYGYTEELIREAARALKPNGILILETPNIQNVMVGLCNFYADPTHTSPMNPDLLTYWLHTSGFEQLKKLFLPLRGPDAETRSIGDVLFRHAPDLGLVAQKKADPDTMPNTALAFSKEYGADTAALTDRHEALLHGDLHGMHDEILALREELYALRGKMECFEEHLHAHDSFISRIRTSLPWRVTRSVYRIPRTGYEAVKQCGRKGFEKLEKYRLVVLGVRRSVLAISRFPAVENKARQVLSRFPRIKRRLRTMLYHAAQEPAAPANQDSEMLSLRAQAIHETLESAYKRGMLKE